MVGFKWTLPVKICSGETENKFIKQLENLFYV